MTHYDTLGVAGDASDAELRAAYRTQARQLHPDLLGDRTATEHADDELAMQRLNEAWHVLGDQDRRRLYDQSLKEFRADDRHVEPATHPPTYVGEPAGPSRVIPAVALLGVVLACAIAAAFFLTSETSSRTPIGGVDAVTVGDCVTLRGGHVSEIVSCNSPNDGQVVAEIPRSQNCATTEERLVDGPLGGSTFVCLNTTGRP